MPTLSSRFNVNCSFGDRTSPSRPCLKRIQAIEKVVSLMSESLSMALVVATKNPMITVSCLFSDFPMAQDEVSGAGATASKQPSLDFGQVECPVCLQPSIHPVKLHCGHIFCFLCVKGVAIQSKRCPMCRQEIAENYLDDPDLLFPLDATALRTDENSYVW